MKENVRPTAEQEQIIAEHLMLCDEFIINDDGNTVLAKTIDGYVEIKKRRKPTPKKEYKYVEPAIGTVIGIDKDGNNVLWEGFMKNNNSAE